MSALGLWLAALAVADALAGGWAGEPRGAGRTVAGVAAGTLVAAGGSRALGFPSGRSIGFAVAVAVGLALWCGLRGAAASRPRLGTAALVALTLGTAGILAVCGTWSAAAPALDAWVRALPFSAIRAREGADGLILALGAAAALGPTANAAVRAVLRAAGTELETARHRLRGGRILGPLERWLVFGLAVAGEPTAAALAISAKSLLRFPELSRAAREPAELLGPDADPVDRPPRILPVDAMTEYFLLGSLTSWLLALLAAALVV